MDVARDSLNVKDPTNNNNNINDDDGDGNNDGFAPPAPGPPPDKHFEDQATQTEDEDECGDEDSYCSYNEYSECERERLVSGWLAAIVASHEE